MMKPRVLLFIFESNSTNKRVTVYYSRRLQFSFLLCCISGVNLDHHGMRHCTRQPKQWNPFYFFQRARESFTYSTPWRFNDKKKLRGAMNETRVPMQQTTWRKRRDDLNSSYATLLHVRPVRNVECALYVGCRRPALVSDIQSYPQMLNKSRPIVVSTSAWMWWHDVQGVSYLMWPLPPCSKQNDISDDC